MQFKSIALATTSLMAASLAAAPAEAAKAMMGDVSLGYAHNWTDIDFGSGSSVDFEYPSVFGSGRVNIPYVSSTSSSTRWGAFRSTPTTSSAANR